MSTENLDRAETVVIQAPAGFWIRVLATFIDGLVLCPVVVLFFMAFFFAQSLPLLVLVSIPGLVYKPFMESRYGATLGKIACGIGVSDGQGKRLSLGRAYVRFLPWLAIGVISLFTWAWVLMMPERERGPDLIKLGQLLQRSPFYLVATILNWVFLIDCLIAAFNARKRALHDMVAGSFCVWKVAVLGSGRRLFLIGSGCVAIALPIWFILFFLFAAWQPASPPTPSPVSHPGQFGNLPPHANGPIFLPLPTWSKVQHGNTAVFYMEGATQGEADRLGSYLVKSWKPAHPIEVKLKKTAEGYQVYLVLKKQFQKDEKFFKGLEFDGARISRDAFDGTPVELHACDELWQTLKVLPPRADLRLGVVKGRVEVFYPADIKKEDAQRLVEYLAEEVKKEEVKKQAGPIISFKLAKRGTIWEVHMVIRSREQLNDQAIVAGLHEDRKAIAANVFPGASVEMHLCDDLFNVVQVLK